MAILYFIHTFIYSQLNASPVSFSDFKMVEDGKYQFFSWGKVSFSRLMALLRQEFSMEKQLYRLGGIPQVINVWIFELCSSVDTKVAVKESEVEKLDLPSTSFGSDHHGTSSMPSSTENQDQRSYRVNLPQVTKDHNSFNDFSTTPPQFLMRESIHVSRTVSAPLTKTGKDVPTGRRSDCKKQMQIQNAKEKQTAVEIEDDKANQAPSFLKNGEQDEKDVENEKQSDIIVEKMQPLEIIILGREHDLTLMIYKPPPTTPAKHEISDTAILSPFSTPKKNVSDYKNAPALRLKKPLKIYRSPFFTHFRSSSKGKKKLASKEQKKYPFEGYHINGDSPIVKMKIFEDWINDGL
ncbi:hypothetical protein FXO38_24793 [Capsicum annuum]|nr:hypothetical protein FXO38_24793 [Capsicum annuum]